MQIQPLKRRGVQRFRIIIALISIQMGYLKNLHITRSNCGECFAHIARQPRKRLLVFINGGLTSLNASDNAAKTLVPIIEGSDRDTYAIFLNWDSDLFSSFGRHLFYERNGISYKGTPCPDYQHPKLGVFASKLEPFPPNLRRNRYWMRSGPRRGKI
jgi:hypothetical protein